MAAELLTAPGLFKRRYAEKIILSFGTNAVLQAKKDIEDFEKIGERYVVPITTSEEQGATYSRADNGAFGLFASVDGRIDQMEVRGFEHCFRSSVSYPGASQSMKKQAASDSIIGRTALSARNNARRRIELDALYGQYCLGIVQTNTPGTAGVNTLTLTEAEYAPAAWVGMKNAKVEVFSTSLAAQRGTASTPPSTFGTGAFTISAINVTNRTITITGDDTAQDSIVATDKVFFLGQYVLSGTLHNSMRGLHLQFGNTGIHFTLDAATNEVVAGNVVDVGATRLDFNIVQDGASRIQDMGSDSDMLVQFVSPKTWSTLNQDLAADRRYDGSYKKGVGELGNRKIIYECALGEIEILAHPLVRRGYSYLFSWDELVRPGSFELNFSRPTAGEFTPRSAIKVSGDILTELKDNAGFEFRLWHDSAYCHTIPSHAVRFENMVN